MTTYISIHASTKEATTQTKQLIFQVYFNPRLHEGGDLYEQLMTVFDDTFQSTPPQRRRLVPVPKNVRQALFQSTPPQRRRLCSCLPSSSYSGNFNPRLHKGGDSLLGYVPISSWWFQSTPPQRRRRNPCRSIRPIKYISIHASTKEATIIRHQLRKE